MSEKRHKDDAALASNSLSVMFASTSKKDPLEAEEAGEKEEGSDAGDGERDEEEAEARAEVEMADEADAGQRIPVNLRRGAHDGY